MLLPEMAGNGGNGTARGKSHQHGSSAHEGADSPRHVVMTARSGAWAASGAAHMALQGSIDEE